VFPLRDDNPTLQKSVITFLIVCINIVVWVFVQGLGTEPALIQSVYSYGLIPGELLQTMKPGTSVRISPTLIYIIEENPNWFSLLSHMFLHGGWFHIIGNMWFLTVFGDNVEDSMGQVRFIIFYLLCGLIAASIQILFNPSSPVPMVGASGAISGIMGAYMILYPKAPVHLLIFFGFFIERVIVPAYFMMAYWFVLQLIGALPSTGAQDGGVAFWAHVGGFIAGVILIPIFKKNDRVEAQKRLYLRRMSGF